MKKFYQEAAVEKQDNGWSVTLDGRTIKTPQKNPLMLPNAQLAQLICDEWAKQGEEIDPAKMFFTGLANAAIDMVAKDRDYFINAIIAFAEADNLLYRAESDTPFYQRQQEKWQPIVDWAQQEFDVVFTNVEGINFVPQDEKTLAILRGFIAKYDHFTLAALQNLCGLSASLIAILSVVYQKFSPDDIWDIIHLEELWQEEQWGRDPQAADIRNARKTEFDNGVIFLQNSLNNNG